MRLNNHSLLQQLYTLGLSGPLFSDVKLLMCLGEKVKRQRAITYFLEEMSRTWNISCIYFEQF